MSESDFYTPTDIDVLRMENELLAFEVRFLRAQQGVGSSGRPGTLASPARLQFLEEAEQDLVLLVRRMSGSALGPVLRRDRGFRSLERRYLRSGDQTQDLPLPDRVVYLEGAHTDLVTLLRRMGRRPLGPLLRRKREFQVLEQRYL